MKKANKITIIVAIILVATGIALFVAGFAMMNFNFKEASDMKYTTNIHKITEDFSSISINISVADIAFIVSDSGESRVEYYENDKRIHTVAVNNGVLCIEEQKNFNMFNFIGIDFDHPRVTLYLSRTDFDSLHINSDTSLIVVPAEFSFRAANIDNHTGDVSYNAPTATGLSIKTTTGRIMVSDISVSQDIYLQANTGHVTLTSARAEGYVHVLTSTGRIHLEDIECGDIDITSSTGNKNISRLKCRNLTSESTTGRTSLTDVIAEGNVIIKADTGDVTLERFDAEYTKITTNTGDVKGTVVGNKVIYAGSNTGRISIPHGINGDACEIRTNTGDIIITIAE